MLIGPNVSQWTYILLGLTMVHVHVVLRSTLTYMQVTYNLYMYMYSDLHLGDLHVSRVPRGDTNALRTGAGSEGL